MFEIFAAIIILLFGVALFFLALWNDFQTGLFTVWGGVLVVLSIFIVTTSTEPTTAEKCVEYNICYELVETVAEYTDYTEEEVADFFIIVNDNVEAWDAIQMLDSSLTDEQINAIMEISAIKQEE